MVLKFHDQIKDIFAKSVVIHLLYYHHIPALMFLSCLSKNVSFFKFFCNLNVKGFTVSY